MANEAKVVWASAITHITANGTLANDVVSTEAIDTALSSTNLLDYPRADLVLTAAWGVAPTVMTTIDVYRRAINMAGTADEPAPSATYKATFVGSFVCSADTSQELLLEDVPLAKECEFQIHNRSGQTISTAWVLKVIPKTTGPAA